ncbi:MAG: hypothetical protein V1722_05355 [Candidatus Micrarchaeota archaeon]
MVISFPREIVEKAWKEIPVGESRDFDEYRVLRTPKLVLFAPHSSNWNKPADPRYFAQPVHIVAFPDPKHFEDFANASRVLTGGGPSWRNPIAIGTLALNPPSSFHTKIGDGPRISRTYFTLSAIQAHYTVGRGKTKEEKAAPFPRKLATRYAGWRKHALDLLMQVTKEKQFIITAGSIALNAYRPKNQKKYAESLICELREAAKKHGLSFKHVRPGEHDQFVEIGE